MHDTRIRQSPAILLVPLLPTALAVLAALASLAFTWPWEIGRPWPRTSHTAVAPLDHPTLETRLQEIDWDVSPGYRFVVFGDQRALAKGEWQEVVRRIADLSSADMRLLFIIDTGDIVDAGKHADQFHVTRQILHTVANLPYLVAVGNHEVESNRPGPGRRNTAAFLRYLAPDFSPRVMYYRKDIGAARFLFLDSNDLVYGDRGRLKGHIAPEPGSRAAAQMAWLVRQLSEDDRGPEATTIVVMHHPFIQSSGKHLPEARALWSYRYGGRILPDILLDGGADLVLTGHTHTYERFLLRRADGKQLRVINISGRLRTDLYWIIDRTRRPRDIAGREKKWFAEKSWRDMDRWEVIQEEAMVDDASDQFGSFTVDADGGIVLEMFFLDETSDAGIRRSPAARIK